jgi:hypothetical protein
MRNRLQQVLRSFVVFLAVSMSGVGGLAQDRSLGHRPVAKAPEQSYDTTDVLAPPKAGVRPPRATASAGQLLISEFRLRGPDPDGAGPMTGAKNEFIEIYNNTDSPHTVAAATGGGYAVVTSSTSMINDNNPHFQFIIPNGTVIPARGHYLACNSEYSLASYAACDITFAQDLVDNDGIALFSGGNFTDATLAKRIDAVGSTAVTNSLYREGTGYAPLTGPAVTTGIEYSFYRDTCGKGGSITALGACPTGGLPKDTDDNASDFVYVDTNGTSSGAGQRLGAPGPENLSSPIQRNASFAVNPLDPCVSINSPPNRVRDFTSDPANNPTFGTLDIRKTVTNQTGAAVTRLRWRIVDLTTFPAPSGIADLRPRTSTAVVVTVDRAPCGSGTSNVTVEGTTLEQPPSQPNGGGFNSSLSSGTVTLGTPLANGATLDLRFLLGIQQTGSFKFFVNVEALP